MYNEEYISGRLMKTRPLKPQDPGTDIAMCLKKSKKTIFVLLLLMWPCTRDLLHLMSTLQSWETCTSFLPLVVRQSPLFIFLCMSAAWLWIWTRLLTPAYWAGAVCSVIIGSALKSKALNKSPQFKLTHLLSSQMSTNNKI